jgi:hypothetical protein
VDCLLNHNQREYCAPKLNLFETEIRSTAIHRRHAPILHVLWLFAPVFNASLFGPLLLLALVWRKLLRQTTNSAVAITALATLNYGYLMASLLLRSTFLGQDYSDRLFITIEINTVLAFGLFVFAVIVKSPVRPLLAFTTFVICLAWFLVWVVNAAV